MRKRAPPARSKSRPRCCLPIVETFERHAGELEAYCRKYGWGYARALTEVPFEELTLKGLREEGLLR